MSFQRKGPGVLASGAIGAAMGLAIVGGAILLLSMPASAQTRNSAAQVSGEFERSFGFAYGQGNSATFITTQRNN